MDRLAMIALSHTGHAIENLGMDAEAECVLVVNTLESQGVKELFRAAEQGDLETIDVGIRHYIATSHGMIQTIVAECRARDEVLDPIVIRLARTLEVLTAYQVPVDVRQD